MKDSNVYIKKPSGRYEAIGLQYDRDWLGDGIWSVSHDDGCTSIKNLNHYGNIIKVGDIKYPDFSKLAGVLEIADKVATSNELHDLLNKNHTLYDVVQLILSKATQFIDEVDQKSEERPLIRINDSNLIDDGFINNGKWYEKVIDSSWYKVYVTTDICDNPRYSIVEVFTKYDDKKIAEFRAEYLHQIYQFIKML